MNQDEYNIKFGINSEGSKIHEEAFKQVSDIRKFEIELYWKRAAYFWALIAVAFAGYFSILSSEHIPSKVFLSFVVSCIGFVFTFAWFLSSRGSKYWQENWENHLDLLEDEITGPLYKTLLERPGYENIVDKFITGPMSVSVSKINQWVCFFISVIWLILAAFSTYNSFSTLDLVLKDWLKIFAYSVSLILALLSCIMMFIFGKTHKKKHSPKAVQRETIIE
ncbi:MULTISPECIES: RipA family octameric membrane protein [Kosakonia]|nr:MULTISPECIES: hypothetical protein [Kosakonia]ANI82428.1 hypothetical protein AWR26_09790 [Kosakonia oryzae]